jgi:DNA end-binding protein Ku
MLENLPMARPYWSGNLQISLVSFGIKLFPATEAKSEIRFHQIDRKSGARVRHQKVSGGDSGDEAPIEKSDIVKGYEYRKGEYVTIEPEDIEHLRIPSRHSLEVTQFVDEEEISPAYFEKPYFVAPEDAHAAEAFAVVRKALVESKKVALGKIAFGGREHLVAISPMPDGEEKIPGMMAYTMRYAEELRKPADYFADIKNVSVDDDQLGLAKELIKRKSAKFAPEMFKDEYEAALREMVEARVHNLPIPRDEPKKASGKVVSLMDALKKSVQEDAALPAKKPATATGRKGITLVQTASAKSTRPKRKSA